MSVNTLEEEEAYCARLELARRKQALLEQTSLAVEEERQRVCTVVQQHCPTCGAPLVTAAYPQHRHRHMLALSGHLARRWGTRAYPCRRVLVSRRAKADPDLTGYRPGVLPIRSC